MSTQLILYPQYYQGFSSTASPSLDEFIVNGILFTGLDSTSLHNTTSSHPTEDAITNAPPTNTNWYRFTTTGGDYGAVTAPFLSIVNVQLSYNAVSVGNTGIYQKLSNLIPGAIYDIKIGIVTPTAAGDLLEIEMWDFTTLFHSQIFSTNTNLISTTFTAQTPNDIILINYIGSTTNLLVSKISITQSPQSPSLIYTDLDDGQVICDLYQEEDIPLSLSVDDFKNVAEKVQSYSKDFSLPATKRNNQIFNDMYEVTRSVGNSSVIFNPYVKTKCVLKEDGFILFEGYLRLIDVKDKEGEISYNVNLYSEVVALADVLKDKTFSDLDFSELEHDYNKSTIKYSWYEGVGLPLNNTITQSSFAYDANLSSPSDHTSVLKYPFIDWNHQFVVGGTGGNPSATAGRPELTTLEQAFRPCIQLKYLINKIFAAAGFNWTSYFFNTSIAGGGSFDFDKLFMDFNWGGDDTPNSISETGSGTYKASDSDSLTTAIFTAIDIPTDNFDDAFGFGTPTANVFTCPVGQDNSTYDIGYNARFRCYSDSATNTNLELRWLHTPSGAAGIPIDATPVIQMETSASVIYSISAGGSWGSGGGITGMTIVDGGYYPSGIAPTITFLGGYGSSNAIWTATLTGTEVTGLTMVSAGSGYWFDAVVSFNSVDPLYTYSGNISVLLQAGDTLQLQMKASAIDSIRQDNVPLTGSYNSANFLTASFIGSVAMTGVTNSIILNTLRGELGQWDFLKGIMTMFNLVTMVDENDPDNILIEPYGDVFINNTNGGAGNLTLADRGIQHDWTDKVDVSEMELMPLTDLNKNTIFKFVEDDDDYAFQVYKESTSGHLYGSKDWDASGFTILEGTKEIIAEPFAATVSKPLMSQFANFVTPALYSMSDDGTSEGFDNSPRIFYNNGRISTGTTYFICVQNGVTGENQGKFLQFSHLTTIPTISTDTTDFLFESQQLIDPIGGPPTNNLFSTYWQPYFNELYSPDTRTMTLKVNLSPADIAGFKFYDTVFIKNRVFRVNKIDYKPNDLAKVEFILIP